MTLIVDGVRERKVGLTVGDASAALWNSEGPNASAGEPKPEPVRVAAVQAWLPPVMLRETNAWWRVALIVLSLSSSTSSSASS